MDAQLVRARDVAQLLQLSTRQVWRLLAMECLPRPVRLGRSVRWRLADLDRFIADGCDMRSFARTASAGRFDDQRHCDRAGRA
jgi:predicted DNA-binding transcriptional regulator AlpA